MKSPKQISLTSVLFCLSLSRIDNSRGLYASIMCKYYNVQYIFTMCLKLYIQEMITYRISERNFPVLYIVLNNVLLPVSRISPIQIPVERIPIPFPYKYKCIYTYIYHLCIYCIYAFALTKSKSVSI